MYIAVYFIIAVLAGLGVGSGGLLVAFLTLVRDTPQALAAGTNLIFFVAALAASVGVSIKNKKLSSSFLVSVMPSGAIGALLGSLLSLRVSPDFIRGSFGLFMGIAGAATLVSAANQIAAKHIRQRKNKNRNVG